MNVRWYEASKIADIKLINQKYLSDQNNCIREALKVFVELGVRKMMFNFEEVQYLHVDIMSVILECYKKILKLTGGPHLLNKNMALHSFQPLVSERMKRLGFNNIIRIVDNPQDAFDWVK